MRLLARPDDAGEEEDGCGKEPEEVDRQGRGDGAEEAHGFRLIGRSDRSP